MKNKEKIIDLSKYEDPTHGFLEKNDKNKFKDKESNNNVKKKEADKNTNRQIGRPRTAEEPLTEKTSLNLTATEYNGLKEKAGLVPVATYLRNVMKEKKII